MKKLFLLLSAIFLLSFTGAAQVNQGSNAGSQAQSSVSKQGRSISSATNVEAQLQNSIDVRKAKVGDPVVLKTTKAIKQNGETIVPKGSNLTGHVTEVQQKAKGNTSSRLGLVFDQIRGQNVTTPITASIISVTGVQAAADSSDLFGSDVMGSSSTSARSSGGASSSSGGSSGGGLLGGVTNSVGGIVNTSTQATGSVTSSAGGLVNNTTQTLGGTTQTVGRTLGGLQISNSVSGSAQGGATLLSSDKNIRLEKGATFQLQLNAMGGN